MGGLFYMTVEIIHRTGTRFDVLREVEGTVSLQPKAPDTNYFRLNFIPTQPLQNAQEYQVMVRRMDRNKMLMYRWVFRTIESARQHIRIIHQQYSPHEVDQIPKMAKAFKDRPEVFYASICKKYRVKII